MFLHLSHFINIELSKVKCQSNMQTLYPIVLAPGAPLDFLFKVVPYKCAITFRLAD